MRVLRADSMGLCFGVRDALRTAFAEPSPTDVAVHGELVHNQVVLDRLAERGFEQTPEGRRAVSTDRQGVLITAHGVSDRERARLVGADKRIIDSTCPLVRHAHTVAGELSQAGYHVIVLGKRGHVEVRGLVEDLPHADVVSSPEQVAFYPYPKLGVIAQTTFRSSDIEALLDEIRALNQGREVHFVDTVCEPTRRRQRAISSLIEQADRIVVVGGLQSNNTKALAEQARAAGVPAVHVQGPGDLDPAWFRQGETVGLTAGTSTLDETVDSVERRLRAMFSRTEVRSQ